MKSTQILLGLVVLASSALARPRSTLAERVARRAANRAGRPIEYVEQSAVDGGDEAQVSYSSNWSGGVILAPPSGQTFDSVSASFVVPTPKAPSGSSSSGSYSASAWVGIDGDTAQNSILQTGIDFTISGGKVSYDAWYEWYPDYAYDFSLEVSAGDTIDLLVSSSSTTAGKAVITNASTGKSVTKSLTSTAALQGLNAEWIVEDFEEGGSLVSLANFGKVTFANTAAKTKSSTLTASSASVIDIKQNNVVLTDVSISGSSLTVTYV